MGIIWTIVPGFIIGLIAKLIHPGKDMPFLLIEDNISNATHGYSIGSASLGRCGKARGLLAVIKNSLYQNLIKEEENLWQRKTVFP